MEPAILFHLHHPLPKFDSTAIDLTFVIAFLDQQLLGVNFILPEDAPNVVFNASFQAWVDFLLTL